MKRDNMNLKFSSLLVKNTNKGGRNYKMLLIMGLFVLSCHEKDTIIQLNNRGEWYVSVYSSDVKQQKLYISDANNVHILPCKFEKYDHSIQFIDKAGNNIEANAIKYLGHVNQDRYNYYVFYLTTREESKLDKGEWLGGTKLENRVYNKKMWLIEDLEKKGYKKLLERCDSTSFPLN